jgi:hypothetical protein
MKPMGWRILAVTDLGLPSRGPVRLAPGGPDAWLPSLGLGVELSPGARHELGEERAFHPSALPQPPDLQHPGFRKLEAAFRGLKLLMEHAGDAVQVEVLSAPPGEAAARFRAAVFVPEMKELRTPPLGLVLLDQDLSHQAGDLALLSEFGEMARVLQAPVVAQAGPAFFGLKQLNLLPKIDDLPQRLMDAAHSGWQKFQKEEGARWATLTVNRWLQRAPYEGEKTDPAKPETWLWGRGVWILGAAVARSARASGHALEVSGIRGGLFSGLPTRPFPKAANQTVPLAAEVAVPEQFAQEISRAGFTALAGFLGSDSVMIPIAVNAHRKSPGRLTVSGTFSYQLMAGRLAQCCALLLDELPSGGEAVEFLRKSLLEFLGPLAGASGEGSVKVSPAEVKQPDGQTVRVAEVEVRPGVTIEGMPFSYVFQLPLR